MILRSSTTSTTTRSTIRWRYKKRGERTVRKLLYKITGYLPCRLIDINGKPYLERYYLGKVLGITFYLHRFINGDGDREVHDHPWAHAVALVLAGGYKEERVTSFDPTGWKFKLRTLFPGRINFIFGNSYHRIAGAKPETWTLFIHGKRTKSWGFMQPVEGGLLLHQPFDVTASQDWWKKCTSGNTTNRWPLWKPV